MIQESQKTTMKSETTSTTRDDWQNKNILHRELNHYGPLFTKSYIPSEFWYFFGWFFICGSDKQPHKYFCPDLHITFVRKFSLHLLRCWKIFIWTLQSQHFPSPWLTLSPEYESLFDLKSWNPCSQTAAKTENDENITMIVTDRSIDWSLFFSWLSFKVHTEELPSLLSKFWRIS